MSNSRYKYIRQYREDINRMRQLSGTSNEVTVRRAFAQCLDSYSLDNGMGLIDDLTDTKGNRPDGTVRDGMRLDRGYWEAKDTQDNLDNEIVRKINRGYPTTNILFEDTETAVLIQNGKEVMRIDMSEDAQLHKIIGVFLSYQPPEVCSFYRAIKQFKTDLPKILVTLRAVIDKAYEKPKFAKEADGFLRICQETVNPSTEWADVREMLIQHVLTRDIFFRIFDEDGFHSQNNIACNLEHLQNAFMTRGIRAQMRAGIRHYYGEIEATAARIEGHREKQDFLKALYENFYQAYNPKAADRLGVVYTPGEIVRFMIRLADDLSYKKFSRRLCDEGVQILDPASGTGTFITELLEGFPKKCLPKKYNYEMHANEVGILPYYIANLNIEHTYFAKFGEYAEFPGICFVDTLDNLSFVGAKAQGELGAISRKNINRIRQQNKSDISVIIGNPPYNANQRNENERNKNRAYPAVDKRIKETYVYHSTAQKTKSYDMYVRFIRWASDRLGDKGVLTFVSNSSFINGRSFDGFRKCVAKEFSELWIVDMRGGSRGGVKEWAMQEGGNVFGSKTRVGVAVWFFVKCGKKNIGADIYYRAVADNMRTKQKLALLDMCLTLSPNDFERITPDESGNWINQSKSDFDSLISVADKQSKLRKSSVGSAVFNLFSLGVTTNRDDWSYDFDMDNLSAKAKFFCKFYTEERKRFLSEYTDRKAKSCRIKGEDLQDWVRTDIKWTRELRNNLAKNSFLKFNPSRIINSLYRPFVMKRMYYDKIYTHCAYKMRDIFGENGNKENRLICFSSNKNIPFAVLGAKTIPSLDLFGSSAQCLSLWRYVDGERVDNISQWAMEKFRAYYNNKKISAEDIFHYSYAVLHNPAYRQKYADDLLRQFPRVPLYKNFSNWRLWGKVLMDMHINFSDAKPHDLRRTDVDGIVAIPKLVADKQRGKIIVDSQTDLYGIPPLAWEYVLGNNSALEWVLDRYKEKKIKDPMVAAKFNTYRFADYKESTIILLQQITTVSVRTMQIIKKMEKETT